MWKWLSSWFSWRFSLKRLVIAVFFLGAFVGLNARKIEPRAVTAGGCILVVEPSWGWPLPFTSTAHVSESRRPSSPETQELPRTHQSYRLLDSYWSSDLLQAAIFWGEDFHVLCSIFDVLFLVTVLAIVLLFQPPRLSILSLVAGVLLSVGFLYLNLKPSTPYRGVDVIWWEGVHGGPYSPVYGESEVRTYGWPRVVCMTRETPFSLYHDPKIPPAPLNCIGLAADIAIGLVIVFGGAAACEFLVRCRAAKVE